jgi:hypothetical protein
MLDPIQRLLSDATEPNPSRTKISVATAQLAKDWGIYSTKVHAFCTVNELLLSVFYSPIIDCMNKIFVAVHGLG